MILAFLATVLTGLAGAVGGLEAVGAAFLAAVVSASA